MSTTPEANRARVKAWRKANPDKWKAQRDARKDKKSACDKARYQANKEQIKARNKAYYAALPDRSGRLKLSSAWKKANADKVTADVHKRRARLLGSDSPGVSAGEWRQILAKFDRACVYCGAKHVKLTREHLLPLSRGGKDEPANVVPACIHCNPSKGAKTVNEFFEYLIQRLAPAAQG